MKFVLPSPDVTTPPPLAGEDSYSAPPGSFPPSSNDSLRDLVLFGPRASRQYGTPLSLIVVLPYAVHIVPFKSFSFDFWCLFFPLDSTEGVSFLRSNLVLLLFHQF